jgi:hypothetical protein
LVLLVSERGERWRVNTRRREGWKRGGGSRERESKSEEMRGVEKKIEEEGKKRREGFWFGK